MSCNKFSNRRPCKCNHARPHCTTPTCKQISHVRHQLRDTCPVRSLTISDGESQREIKYNCDDEISFYGDLISTNDDGNLVFDGPSGILFYSEAATSPTGLPDTGPLPVGVGDTFRIWSSGNVFIDVQEGSALFQIEPNNIRVVSELPPPGTDKDPILYILEDGNTAVVVPSGPSGDAVFSFGVTGPVGHTGPPGYQGVTGPQGYQGFHGQQGITGSQGLDGNISSSCFEYVFDSSTTASNPGSGNVRLNNATVEGSNSMYISDTDSNSNILSTFLLSLVMKGHIKISKKTDGETFAFYNILSITNVGGWFNIGIQYLSGDIGTIFMNGEDVDVCFASRGEVGDMGAIGYQGVTGSQGATGSQGFQGFTGTQGSQGYQGYVGAQGHQGLDGSQGATGSDGINGSLGFQGATGFLGATGPQGDPGNLGITGSQGRAGYMGATGSQGVSPTFATDLDGLDDVSIRGATCGDTLVYDSSSSEWVNIVRPRVVCSTGSKQLRSKELCSSGSDFVSTRVMGDNFSAWGTAKIPFTLLGASGGNQIIRVSFPSTFPPSCTNADPNKTVGSWFAKEVQQSYGGSVCIDNYQIALKLPKDTPILTNPSGSTVPIGFHLCGPLTDDGFVSNNLKVYYRADNVDGVGSPGNSMTTFITNLAPGQGGLYNGTLVNSDNGVQYNASQFGLPFEYSFDLTNDDTLENGSHIDIGDAFFVNGGENDSAQVDATWEFWVRTNDVNGSVGYLYAEGAANGAGIADVRNSIFVGGSETYNYFNGTTIPTNSNYYDQYVFDQLVVTLSGGNVTFYKNGAEFSSNTVSDVFSFTDPVRSVIGIKPGNETRQALVDLSIVRIYDKALSPAEVLKNYQFEMGITPSFITVWQTVTNNETITLPLDTGGVTSYDFTIDWGDGSPVEHITSPPATHVYAATGLHTVTIDGELNRWFGFPFAAPPANRLISIESFSPQVLFRGPEMFADCLNMTGIQAINAPNLAGVSSLSVGFAQNNSLSDIPNIGSWDVSDITDFGLMFVSCDVFNADIGGWNMSKATYLQRMIQSCHLFNQDLSGWDVSNVMSMNQMFNDAIIFNNGGSSGISGWDVSNVTDMFGMFVGSAFNQPIGTWDVGNVETMQEMFFASAFNQDLSSWSPTSCTTMQRMFDNSPFNSPINGMNVSNVTNMTQMFSNTPFNQPIDSWNVEKVQQMIFMFNNTPFNQNIGDWNPTACFQMGAMFLGSSFNNGGTGTIDNWNTSSAIYMDRMFESTPFNQNIGSWNVENALDISQMFQFSSFNNGGTGSIDNWNPIKCTSMRSMFQDSSFNQPIGSWNVSNVQEMNNMFQNSPFNQDISSWIPTGCLDMSFMFQGAPFNNGGATGIGEWNVTSVTNMNNMFGQSPFNQPIGDWNVENVEDMAGMFGQSPFNQPIGDWNVEKVQTMEAMFFGTPFDQDLGAGGATGVTGTGWNIKSVTNLSDMFNGATLSTPNYDSLLLHWASHPDTPSNQNFHGGNSQYSLSATGARQFLGPIGMGGTKNWTITDGGWNGS